MSKYKQILSDYSSTTIDDILSGEYKRESVKLGGIIIDLKIIRTKKKAEKMASVILEDLSGQMELIIFPKMYKEKENLIQLDKVVFVKGNIDRNEESVKIIVNDVVPISEVAEKFSNRVIFSFYNYPKKELISVLNRKLKKYHSKNGKHDLYFKINIPQRGEVLIHCPNFRLNNIDAMLNEVNGSIKNLNIILE